MPRATARLLDTHDERAAAARIVFRQMLAPMTDEKIDGTAELWALHFTHGAFSGGTVVGTGHWFPASLVTPGEPLATAAVTGVAVLSDHRRQGHLTRIMRAQLKHVREQGVPTAVLLAAEYPIYARFGYGPATEACGIELDAGAAQLLTEPVSGTFTHVEPAELRAPYKEVSHARWARTPGALMRDDTYWDRAAGLKAWPWEPLDLAKRRAVLWHDGRHRLAGVVVYKVEEEWKHNRPAGTARVEALYGTSPEAERELWRHLCTLDWIRTVKAGSRAVDDPAPLWFRDPRMATMVDHSDNLWLRLLDLKASFAARRSPIEGGVVLEVVDPLGFANGRWKVALGPAGGSAAKTKEAADLTLSASALGAAFLGGHTLARLAAAGLVDEERSGALEAASALLATGTRPWCPVGF